MKWLAAFVLLAMASCQKTNPPAPAAAKTPAVTSNMRVVWGGLMYFGTPEDDGFGNTTCLQPCGFCHLDWMMPGYVPVISASNNEAPVDLWINAQGHLVLAADMSYTPSYLSDIAGSGNFDVAVASELPHDLIDAACDDAGVPHFAGPVMIPAGNYAVVNTAGASVLEMEGTVDASGEWTWQMRLVEPENGFDPWLAGPYHNMVIADIHPHMLAGEYPTMQDFEAALPQLVYNYVQANIPDYSSVTIATMTEAITANNEFFGPDPFTAPIVANTEQLLMEAENEGMLAPNERQILVTMYSSIEAARWHGPAGEQEMEQALALAHQQWNAQGYNLSADEGMISALSISVAESSFQFWKDSPVARDPQTNALAIPVLGVLAAVDGISGIVGFVKARRAGKSRRDSAKDAGVSAIEGTATAAIGMLLD